MSIHEENLLRSFARRCPRVALRFYRESQEGEVRCEEQGLAHTAEHYRERRVVIREIVRDAHARRREYRAEMAHAESEGR